MADVYYFLPAEEVNHIVDCGLKLSQWAEKKVMIDGELRNCITALLNPKDDMDRYKSSEFRCVKLEVPPKKCYVADRALFEVGQKSPEVIELYHQSVIPIEQYRFGTYRLPECLVTVTLIPGQISLLDKRLDLPVLFEDSEMLYVNNRLETCREERPDFTDAMFYCFYSKLMALGKYTCVQNEEKRLAVFIPVNGGETVALRIPDLWEY